MAKKYTTCKTVIKQGKRRLEYVNHRSKTRLPITVGFTIDLETWIDNFKKSSNKSLKKR